MQFKRPQYLNNDKNSQSWFEQFLSIDSKLFAYVLNILMEHWIIIIIVEQFSIRVFMNQSRPHMKLIARQHTHTTRHH